MPKHLGGRIQSLVLSTLYPNVMQPRHGIFIENRLRSQLSSGRIELKVMAPVPWFPLKSKLFGRYSVFSQVPATEVRNGIQVFHPRYPLIPKVGMTAAPFLMAAALISPIKRLIRSGFDFDIFDCYYFFPDGVAGALLSRYFGKPIVISALGTDLNLIPKYPLPKRMIQWAAREASGITAVCQALKDQLLELGVPDKSAKVVLHGVDLELFRPPQDREELRTRLELSRPTLLSVGHLIERKGHHLVIEALQFIPEAQLLIAGDGPEESPLKGLVRGLGLDSRVRFLGHLDQAKLRDYFGAADAMVLASSREGIANVLLESMACGTPVVATRVWGAPEVVTSPDAGALVSDRSAASIAQTIRALFERYPDRANTRRFVEQFSWSRTTNDHLRLFEEILKMGGDRATLASTV